MTPKGVANSKYSGHVYVEADAYASPTGTDGCEKGALRHRANGLKFVLAMERCDGCVFKNADGVCQKYNKQIIDEIPSDLAEGLRNKHLASHEMTDAEEIAALFATGVEAAEAATEFGLHHSALDDIETEAPTHEPLDEIFFGGFEI